MLSVYVYVIISFAITFLFTPVLAKKLLENGITGRDLHKEGRIEVPEMVGITILLGFLTSVLIAFLVFRDERLLIGVFIGLLVGILGIADGIKRLTPIQKVGSLYLIGLLFAFALKSNPGSLDRYMDMGVIDMGSVGMGLLFFLVIPFLFMAASNFTNMLAGFNGLEIGTGAIASLGVAIVSLMQKEITSFILSSAMFGALLAFLYYNRYPARVFPGDVGTLIIGAVLFVSIMFGGIELAGFFIFLPYIIDAGLKYLSAGIMTRESQIPTEVKDGKLYIPEGSNLSLPRLILKGKPLKEKDIVYIIWLLEGLFCILAIALVIVLI